MRTWIDSARDDMRAILAAAIEAASPQMLMRSVERSEVRPDAKPTRLVALGKAAGGMAAHAQRWGPFEEAIVVAPYDAGIPEFECLVGDHPLPSRLSVAAGERILAAARATGPDERLLVLLSGGASALAEVPLVPLRDLALVNDLMLKAAMPIAEINCVRRHLSAIKGGQLARECLGEIRVLAISDVEPGDITSLGSGPTAADPTTFAEARHALRKHGLLEAVPAAVREHLAEGAMHHVPETLKPGDPVLDRVFTRVLADNETAIEAASVAAATRGYATRTLPGWLRGEARARGAELAAAARELTVAGRPAALVAGGETVVRVVGHGRGGRSQELALAAVDGLSSVPAVLAAIGTDGQDGPTDAAGAIVDGRTRARADALGLDAQAHLEENDAYPFFDALDDLVRTGPTGTNVRDLVVLLVGPA